MAACCESCKRGGACEGGAAACAMKASGEAHPIVAKAREITGSHPAYRPAAKSSGGIAELTSEADAMGYYPSNAELEALGISRDLWDMSGGADRLRLARGGAGGGTGGATGGGASAAEQAANQATIDGDEAAFQRALAQLPERDRAGVLERHLRARGASDDAVRAGLFALAQQGLTGLATWLNSDLQRDLEQIRGRSATEQARIREEQETARAEIRAATERYRLDHQQTQQPAAQSGGNAVLYIGVTVGVLGVLAALVMSSRKGGG